MAVVLMRDGAEHLITEDRGANLTKYLENNPTKKFINLNGKGLTVSISAIAQVLTNSDYQDMTHRKNGEKQCEHGHWRGKNEERCGTCIMEFSKTSVIHNLPKGSVSTKASEAWLELLRRNMDTLRKTGVYGNLKNINDLELPLKPQPSGS